MTTNPSPSEADANVKIGPNDSFDIRGPRRELRSALPSLAGTAAVLAVLTAVVLMSGGVALLFATIPAAFVLLAETAYLRQQIKFQLTYDFLKLPDGSVHFWQDISDLELAPDGVTLLVRVFERATLGVRSESDPVREQPVEVSLRGWPYPPAEITATLVGQFENYLADVATDEDTPDKPNKTMLDDENLPDVVLQEDPDGVHIVGLRVTQDYVAGPSTHEFLAPTQRQLEALVCDLPANAWIVLSRDGTDPNRFLQIIRWSIADGYGIEFRDGGAEMYRAASTDPTLVGVIAVGWARADVDWRGMIGWESFTP